jgi:hypothetical protein
MEMFRNILKCLERKFVGKLFNYPLEKKLSAPMVRRQLLRWAHAPMSDTEPSGFNRLRTSTPNTVMNTEASTILDRISTTHNFQGKGD